MAARETLELSDLAHLREDSLQAVLICVVVALSVWCLALFQATNRFGPIWRGPVLLAIALSVALFLRARSASLAAAALILGLAVADLYVMWLTGSRLAPYLLPVVVSLVGLLFNLHAVIAATVVCGAAVVFTGSLHLGYSPLAAELLAPVFVIVAVGTMSALSVRNLYLALFWAWERTKAAQRNEQELRDRRAELVRTAKALDEACQRLEHLNYDLARAREAAEEARLLKQQFTTNVSHELRTPLNVIAAFSEMMYLSPQSYGGVALPQEYRGDVREIYRSSQHLLRLIDDVLDLSQIEAHRMKIHLEIVALPDVVAEAVDIMRPLVRGKEIELRVDVPADLPPVLVDRARVRQILLNLLNNARRFTERGSIIVTAAEEGAHVRVTVADTGIGIAPANHEKVFEEFRQIDGSTTRQRGGAGLGLAISKRFVEMHGGHIWVESEGVPGRGSQFHFTLPLARSGHAEVSGLHRMPLPLKPPKGRGRTLVLVDRDPAMVRLLEQGLEEYQVVPAAEVAAVPDLVARLHPRAVVLNAAHQRHAWRQWRQLAGTVEPPLPIILCPLVGERQLGQALGVLDYLIKPISRAALMALLDRLGPGVRRILILDDDPRMARVLSRMIRSTGREYDVVRAYDAAEGLLKMRRQAPDLVLLDLILPEADGWAVLAEMRADPKLQRVQVAIITAQERTPEEERRLSGKMLLVANEAGFSNEEALFYLRRLLDGPASEGPRPPGSLASTANRSV